MTPRPASHQLPAILLALLAFAAPLLADPAFLWQQPQAAISPKGDLTWSPHPFLFQKGSAPRYIDFDAGNDKNDGATPDSPWKHHPWDPNAAGLAKAATGIHTYIFKRGVVYRGALVAQGNGTSDDPLRLTSDPAWGAGEAIIAGSQPAQNWIQGADRKDIPSPEKVWHTDLPFAPRALWLLSKDGSIARIPLARTPNWKVSNPDDVKSEWFHWDFKDTKPFGLHTKIKNENLQLGIDSLNLNHSPDYYQDALLWTEHGWVAGSPYPVRVEGVDLQKHSLAFQGRYGGVGQYVIIRYNRYYLEDKPQYLDDPTGEFWFDKKAAGGTLYLRPPHDADPNNLHLEAPQLHNLIDIANTAHLQITGLTFRFNNPWWNLAGVPYVDGENLDPACIRVLGSADDLRIANCRFQNVTSAVRMKAPALSDSLDQIRIEDNDIAWTDRGAFTLAEGSKWAEAQPASGLLHDVRILRNNLFQIGLRPSRFDQAFAIDVVNAQTLEIAGNILYRCYGGGIDAMCGKRGGSLRDCPLSRVLIHHNKVTDSLLSIDDYGGIETWQGGPAYVYNNISGNPGGYRNFYLEHPDEPGTARFGFAYYLDGAFKNYHFNNIAWGKSSDPLSPLGNRAAFQEIFSYQNTFFNNSVYNFVEATRRQRPEAGRDKFLGNIFENISLNLFRHSDKLGLAPNIHDAGAQRDSFALETNANSHNVLFNIQKTFGTFEPQGGDYTDLQSLQNGYAKHQQLASDVGAVAPSPPMRDPANLDFRPVPSCPATGVKVFVPWALYAEVAEWNFYHAGNDPARILDEHWYLAPYYVERADFRERPMFPLHAVNVTAKDYVNGDLEDWTHGALKLDGKTQYAVIANQDLTTPFNYDVVKETDSGKQTEHLVAAGEDLKSPQIHRSSFLIEAYFKTDRNAPGGILIQKQDATAGYSLTLNDQGQPVFSTTSARHAATLTGKTSLNDGRYHHLIAQSDRPNKTLTLFIDGKPDAQAPGPDPQTNLANPADLYVGGSPAGRHLGVTLDFLRISLGSLADAKTSIEELYAWEFDGPAGRDFCGNIPNGKRAAGAIGWGAKP